MSAVTVDAVVLSAVAVCVLAESAIAVENVAANAVADAVDAVLYVQMLWVLVFWVLLPRSYSKVSGPQRFKRQIAESHTSNLFHNSCNTVSVFYIERQFNGGSSAIFIISKKINNLPD